MAGHLGKRLLSLHQIKPPLKMHYCMFHSFTGTYTKCLNMGSYNYLGFAECEGPCATAAQKTTYDMGLGVCSPRQELGMIEE